jgi:hypothetical protein
MSKRKKDNHGAAASGAKSEKNLKKAAKAEGAEFLKKLNEFDKLGLVPWGRVYHKPPVHWNQKTKTGRQRKFVSDGFVLKNGKGVIIEQKHSDKHGTTEEKVFYDLKKIQHGVYGNTYPLWYVFTGKACKNIEAYREFEKEVKREKLNVKIIWGLKEFKKELKNL